MPSPRRTPRPRAWIGTSGYVYAHWRGRFYPRELPASRWLPWYATHFDTVELNAPFYRLPTAEAFARWRAQVPARFRFAVKASRFMTHLQRLRDPDDPLALLLDRARHLADRLGPVLFQLPASFAVDLGRLDGLIAALARQRTVPGLRAVLEVRHPSWLVDAVFGRLRDAGIALCLADWRDVPVEGPVTTDFAYVRRHGWPSRPGRPYPPGAVGRDAAAVRDWQAGGLDAYVYYNNDERGFAVTNARALRRLVEARRHGRRTSQARTSAASTRASRRYTRARRPRAA
jgi:uncharacterized protein YecE (DUF72 family)